MRAIRRFTVRPVLPSSLRPLEDLVTNLRWSWHPETQDLFQSVSPEAWSASHHDPVRFLGNIPAERLRVLGSDKRFIKRLELARADLEEYLTGNRWYQTLGDDQPRSIAYFSPEFGITAVLPQYSGGLGILAGDHLKSASDLGVPIIGVGLLYRHGYFYVTTGIAMIPGGATADPQPVPGDLATEGMHESLNGVLGRGIDRFHHHRNESGDRARDDAHAAGGRLVVGRQRDDVGGLGVEIELRIGRIPAATRRASASRWGVAARASP